MEGVNPVTDDVPRWHSLSGLEAGRYEDARDGRNWPGPGLLSLGHAGLK